MIKFNKERGGFLMVKNHKKIAEQPKPETTKGTDQQIIVGPAYDFLFEGENNDYDKEYGDYI